MAEGQSLQANTLDVVVQRLQAAVENLQSSINQHQHQLNPKYCVDGPTLLKYAHKIAYTSFAPLRHEAGQPLPPNIRPPTPQDWQFRSSQLHQFQAEWDAKQQKQTPTVPLQAAPQLPETLQLPAGLKLPPMPAGWKPGMPIPGPRDEVLGACSSACSELHHTYAHRIVTQEQRCLEEMLSVSPAAEPAAPAQVPAQAQQQQAPAQTQQAAAKADQNAEQPEPQFRAPPPANALRPAPFIPDFVLNPGLEAVEEDYSSSDYSDEEI